MAAETGTATEARGRLVREIRMVVVVPHRFLRAITTAPGRLVREIGMVVVVPDRFLRKVEMVSMVPGRLVRATGTGV
ncbi:hypothetical protein [Streptosporangium subroseum]|uniref:hypothetical protein n=1 Tax=Streptosporangium subroseum TaxID=106412 RepID=UPI000B78735E|nr:hypothetical protein [Streptosporangium subroseum]